MALSRKEARDRVCIAVASQLQGVSLFDLLEKRLNGEDILFEEDLGIDEDGRGVFVRPLNIVFKHVPTDSGQQIRWGNAEVKGLLSVRAIEDRAIEKSKA